MAETPFRFRLVTPQRLLLETDVVSLLAPGSEGYLGVLAHHAPLITMLRPGRLEIRTAEGRVVHFAVTGGFLEVSGNRASVLADAAERAKEIDRSRAEAALRRAEKRLRHLQAGAGVPHTGHPGDEGPVDRDRALRALERAKARLSITAAERE
ncbi:MAG TPA: ATP synthase F1 subunit epsilon [Candidatus Eisenbacteria bacterium]|jgi:F-type H+-transporting ATPase subunit epsilon